MSVVSIKSLEALKDDQELKFNAGINAIATKSGKAEVFVVYIFKGFKMGLKLQWEQNGRPNLPKLKDEVMNDLCIQTHNYETMLTSGFNDARGAGMSPESCIRFVDLLKKKGIIISAN